MLRTPVALSVYNRPDTTARVFAAIAEAQPKQLLVFADGAATPEHEERCAEARAVAERVDWDCDVRYDYSPVNLGARQRYASGVDWVFSQVDEAIVLDDDCLPDPTFFGFCESLLERYRDDPRVLMISGSNYLHRWKQDEQSYHFSLFGSVWGWATWKRAWDAYDVSMSAWGDEQVRDRIRALIDDDEIWAIQAKRFDRLHAEASDQHSWDLPWALTRLAEGGLTIVPAVNLVTNLGNADGRGIPAGHPLAALRAEPLPAPLRPPAAVEVDRAYDRLHVGEITGWWASQQAPPAPSDGRTRARRTARRLLRTPVRALRRAAVRAGLRERTRVAP